MVTQPASDELPKGHDTEPEPPRLLYWYLTDEPEPWQRMKPRRTPRRPCPDDEPPTAA